MHDRTWTGTLGSCQNYERVADHCSNIAVYMMQLNDTGLGGTHDFTELRWNEKREVARIYETRKMNLNKRRKLKNLN